MIGEYTEEHLHSEQEKISWFGDGEWVKEPDIVKFYYKTYACKIKRICLQEPHAKEFHIFGGYLCGYVRVPKDHIFYGKGYDEMEIDCHWGLTFSEFEEKEYWIGFDCAHSADYVPSMEKLKRDNKEIFNRFPLPEKFKKHAVFNPIYRNIEYCVQECKTIVDQLAG